MASHPRLMPSRPRLFTAVVARSERISPSFQRVTITGPELGGFAWRGYDHWFRLFLPPSAATPLHLPSVSGRSWYPSYLLIPGDVRPLCSNYTVAGYRQGADGGELDIDVVLHGDHGDAGPTVAGWAVDAQVGSPVGILDQGLLFDPPADAGELVLACDETGLPAVRSILRDLEAAATGTALLEVPASGDVAEVAAPAGVTVTWLPRDDPSAHPGQLALSALQRHVPGPDAYAFVVGESALATGGRRALKKAGLAASRITFSGFWKA